MVRDVRDTKTDEAGIRPAVGGARGVLVLDLDGTVRKGVDELGRFVNGPLDVEVFPDAVARMAEWKAAGGRIIGASNQAGVALGHMSARECGAAVNETSEQTGHLFDTIAFCMHEPAAGCACRKPRTGLVVAQMTGLLAHLRETHPLPEGETDDRDEWYPGELALFVGDRPEDRECAATLEIGFLDAAVWRAGGGCWQEMISRLQRGV